MGSTGGGTSGNIVFISWLRAIAPLIVLWSHLGGWWLSTRKVQSPLYDFWTTAVVTPLHLHQDGGHLGVLLFFLVSGFIITHSSLREERFDFALKRIFRIFPMLWIAVILVVILHASAKMLGFWSVLGPSSGSQNLETVLKSAFLVNWFVGPPYILSVTWTLAIEMLFYGLVWLFIPLTKKNPLAASWAMLAVCVTVYGLNSLSYFKFVHFMWIWMYLPFLLVGRAFYLGASGKLGPAQAIVYGLCCYGAFVLLFSNTNPMFWQPGAEIFISHLYTIAIFSAFWVGSVTVLPRIVGFFSDTSYSLYLLHAPLGGFFIDFLATRNGLRYELALVIALPVLFGCVWLTHTYIEKPAQNFARALITLVRERKARVTLASPAE
ncbi:acyltransferase family protein [Microvirga flavescens]|uniref:acyltransferase family protein n=1 Tax=Microvirga flavescens TaxID=2249811 RepID=UPI0013009B46|nr:acyltransferase [Microvirga flavescens]